MIPFMYYNNIDKYWVVILAKCHDMKAYNAAWMGDPHLPGGLHPNGMEAAVLVPDLDLLEEKWIFDQGTTEERYFGAIQKMKELWTKV